MRQRVRLAKLAGQKKNDLPAGSFHSHLLRHPSAQHKTPFLDPDHKRTASVILMHGDGDSGHKPHRGKTGGQSVTVPNAPQHDGPTGGDGTQRHMKFCTHRGS